MTAADRALAESQDWMEIAQSLDSLAAEVGRATELALTAFDPSEDLARRARRWSHVLEDGTPGSLARFAAGLAKAESEAWARDDPVIATQAFSDRRFLIGDRLVHWVTPWLLSLTGAEHIEQATESNERLLAICDRHRPAPALTATEGLYPPGHDSIGPILDVIDPPSLLDGWLCRVESVSADVYDAAAEVWARLAEAHPGTRRLWLDMESRARRSAALLRVVAGQSSDATVAIPPGKIGE